jgi:hypothetical protein
MKLHRSLALVAVAASALVTSASAQILVAGWNFNDVSTFPGSPASALTVSSGSGLASTSWLNANVTNFTGSSINLIGLDTAGRDLSLANGGTTGSPANAGGWIQFQVSTLGQSGVSLSYAGRTTSTGMRDLVWSWSTDGSSFTPFQSVDHVTLFTASTYGLVNVNFSSVTALDNAPAVYLRGTFNTLLGQSNPSATGSTRLDNVQITVVPEPSSAALAVAGGFLLLAALRRRH